VSDLFSKHAVHPPQDLSNQATDAITAGELDRAEKLLWKSLKAEQAAENLAGQSSDWGNLGLVYGMKGRLQQAIEYLWKANSLHTQLGDDRLAGLDLIHLSECYSLQEEFCTAKRCLAEAIVHFSRARAENLLEQAYQLLSCHNLPKNRSGHSFQN